MIYNNIDSLLINQYKIENKQQNIWSISESKLDSDLTSTSKVQKSAWIEDEESFNNERNNDNIFKNSSSKIGFKKWVPCCIGLTIGLLVAAIPFATVSTIWIDTLIKSTELSTISETSMITVTTTTSTATTSTATTTTTTPFPAIATSTLSAYCGCEGFTLSLTNIKFNSTNATYEWQSSPMGQNIWTSVNGTRIASSFAIPRQIISMDYRCIIYVLNPLPVDLTSTTVTVLTTTNTTYCPPRGISCSIDNINSFILFGEANTGINDTNTGCTTSPRGYNNRTSESVSLYQNKNYTAQVSSLFPSSQHLAIWIDFNDDFNFELWERVSYKLLNSTYLTDVIVSIPSDNSGATVGIHRMRATVIYTAMPDPCALGNTLGETHDYTVNILAAAG